MKQGNWKRQEIVDVLMQHEHCVGELYRCYAESQPDREDFWLRLAGEEDEHAEAIKLLGQKVGGRDAFFRPGRFRYEEVKESLDALEKEIDGARDKGNSWKDALEAALQLEDKMMEKRFFEVVRGDSPVLQGVLRKIKKETGEHRDRLRSALEKAEHDRGSEAA